MIWQAEGADAFSQFHLYVCSAFLVKWSEKLRQMDFQVHPPPFPGSYILRVPGYYHVPAVSPDTGLGRP